MTPGVRGWVAFGVVALLLVPTTTGVVASAPSSVDRVTFESADMVAERGDVATVGIRGEPGSTIRVTIGGATTDYGVRTAVSDVDGDGAVAIRMNTRTAGRSADPSAAFAAAGDDRIEYVHRASRRRSEPLPPGRYNVIAANGDTSVAAVLHLVNGSVTGGAVYTALAGTPDRSVGEPVGTVPARGGEVVGGDLAVLRFDAGGLGGLPDDHPGTDVVVPADSSPGAVTTHTFAVTPPENATLRTLTVDYGAGDGGVPGSVLAGTVPPVTVLGVDANGDGIVDRESVVEPSDVGVTTTMSGDVSLEFDSAPDLNATDTLYLRLPMRNPPLERADRIRVERNGEALPDADRIVYGPEGAGSLGHGVDLRIDAPNATVADPVAGIEYRYDDAANELVVVAPTDTLRFGRTYGVELRLLEEFQYGTESGTTVAFTVARPRADLRMPSGPSLEDGTRAFRVVAATNLAPGSEVAIEITAENGSGGAVYTAVTRDLLVDQRVTIPEPIRGSSVLVVVKHDGRSISNATLIEFT